MYEICNHAPYSDVGIYRCLITLWAVSIMYQQRRRTKVDCHRIAQKLSGYQHGNGCNSSQ